MPSHFIKIPENLTTLRYNYMACLKLADETDSKKEDSHLRQEAKNILESLKKECNHPYIVCLARQYDGSYSMDYDDHSSEHRICFCCGIEEYAYDNKFINLKQIHYIARPKCPTQLKQPLLYLFSELEELLNY